MNKVNLTILMPCLNEEENIAFSIRQAQIYLASINDRFNHTGEILIVDNNSTDNSAAIAKDCGARVVSEPRPGYGRALRTGLLKARGEVIIFGDCDSTYDFSNLDPIYKPLFENKYDFVTGDRFAGQMEDGAMSWSHKLGVPFKSPISKPKLILRGWLKNYFALAPFEYGIYGSIALVIFIMFFMVIPVLKNKVRVRSKIDRNCVRLYLAIGAVPYIRYMLIPTHTSHHYFFMHRAQAVTVMALCFVVHELVEKNPDHCCQSLCRN